ncbi:MAG: hypothetical protein QXL96_08330, partial [Ignisphaera sp.]
RKDEGVSKSLVTRALNDFLELTDLKEDNIVFVKSYLNEYGYPIHNLKIREARSAVLEWLREKNIISIGRWGHWFYWNMDQVYKNVQGVVDNLVKG